MGITGGPVAQPGRAADPAEEPTKRVPLQGPRLQTRRSGVQIPPGPPHAAPTVFKAGGLCPSLGSSSSLLPYKALALVLLPLGAQLVLAVGLLPGRVGQSLKPPAVGIILFLGGAGVAQLGRAPGC